MVGRCSGGDGSRVAFTESLCRWGCSRSNRAWHPTRPLRAVAARPLWPSSSLSLRRSGGSRLRGLGPPWWSWRSSSSPRPNFTSNALAVEPTSATVGETFEESVPSAGAKSIGEILAEFGEAQNGLLEGDRLFQSGDPAAALLALQEAQAVPAA